MKMLVWLICFMVIAVPANAGSPLGLNGMMVRSEDVIATSDIVLTVNSDTRQLVILTDPLDVRAEYDSFEQFSNHYLLYWVLWMGMFLQAAVWVD